jgi:hypothetical protein
MELLPDIETNPALDFVTGGRNESGERRSGSGKGCKAG